MRRTVTVTGLLLASVAAAAPGPAASKPARGTPALTILLPDRDRGRAVVVYTPGQEKQDGGDTPRKIGPQSDLSLYWLLLYWSWAASPSRTDLDIMALTMVLPDIVHIRTIFAN